MKSKPTLFSRAILSLEVSIIVAGSNVWRLFAQHFTG